MAFVAACWIQVLTCARVEATCKWQYQTSTWKGLNCGTLAAVSQHPQINKMQHSFANMLQIENHDVSTKMLMLKNVSNTNSHFSTYNLLKRECEGLFHCPTPFTL